MLKHQNLKSNLLEDLSAWLVPSLQIWFSLTGVTWEHFLFQLFLKFKICQVF